MNSDKFDRIVLDLLYGELDELTTAAAKRHMDQSARAREIFAHFKATRQLSVLPVHAPPADFEAALMERERRTLAELPLHHRIGRVVSMLAGYAMRPQLIMGALLLLMIGSSLMFLRARPGQHSAVQVTERGSPEAEGEAVLPVAPASAEPPPTLTSGVFRAMPAVDVEGAARAGDAPSAAVPALAPPGVATRPAPAEGGSEGLDTFQQALDLYRAGQYFEARERFERLSRAGGRNAAEAALYAARSVRNSAGCTAAVGRFDLVRARFPGSPQAYEATLRGAQCQQRLGDTKSARRGFESLLGVSSYAEQARKSLAELSGAAKPAAAPR